MPDRNPAAEHVVDDLPEAYRRDFEGRACRITEAVGIRSIGYPFDGLFHLAKGPFG